MTETTHEQRLRRLSDPTKAKTLIARQRVRQARERLDDPVVKWGGLLPPTEVRPAWNNYQRARAAYTRAIRRAAKETL